MSPLIDCMLMISACFSYTSLATTLTRLPLPSVHYGLLDGPLSFRKSVGTILRLRYLEELDIQFANIQMMDDDIRELLDQDVMAQITHFAGWRYHSSIPFRLYLRKL